MRERRAALHRLQHVLENVGREGELRGPTGSITRSIKALQAKAKHVKIPFVLMLVFFTFELICSFWLLNIPFSKRLAMTLVAAPRP